MSKINNINERVKREFYLYLNEAKGFCDSTVNQIANAINLYEDFTKSSDFSTFNKDKAIEFKDWLEKRKYRGKTISVTTYYTYLSHLRKFFTWLCMQAGYKSKINPDSVDYLRISKKEKRIATQPTPRKYPSLKDVLDLIKSIPVNTEIDKRDRALIAFTLLSGMRDKAIVTLPLNCFDEENLIINQNPRQDVQTKFSKQITTILFKFDDGLLQIILRWVKYLKDKGFTPDDPMFPKTKSMQSEDGLSFEVSDKVEPYFWKGTGSIRKIFQERAKKADLPYFPPHSFRHLAIDLAVKRCENGAQIKAVSQNFGHEKVATTFSAYANYEPDRLSEILKSIDFNGEANFKNDDALGEIKDLLHQLIKNKQ